MAGGVVVRYPCSGMMVVRVFLAGALLLGTLAACGDSEPLATAPVEEPLSDVDLPLDLRRELDELCVWWGRTWCGTASQYCVATETAVCRRLWVPVMAESLREGRLVYQPEYRAAYEADLPYLSGLTSDREALMSWRSLFRGTVENGQACHAIDTVFPANECAGGWCDAGGVCPGACHAYAGTGEACGTRDDLCSPADACIDGTCVERGAEGQPCEVYGCTPQLRCLGAAGQCGYARELDESCELSTDCREGTCSDGVCTLSGQGAPCSSDGECDVALSCIGNACLLPGTPVEGSLYACDSGRDCAEGLTCLSGDVGSGCGAPPTIGSLCGNCPGCPTCPLGLECAGQTKTDLARCVVPADLGEPCIDGGCLLGTYCLDGTCVHAVPRTCDAEP